MKSKIQNTVDSDNLFNTFFYNYIKNLQVSQKTQIGQIRFTSGWNPLFLFFFISLNNSVIHQYWVSLHMNIYLSINLERVSDIFSKNGSFWDK